MYLKQVRERNIFILKLGCGGRTLQFMFMTSISGFLNVMTLCGCFMENLLIRE